MQPRFQVGIDFEGILHLGRALQWEAIDDQCDGVPLQGKTNRTGSRLDESSLPENRARIGLSLPGFLRVDRKLRRVTEITDDIS